MSLVASIASGIERSPSMHASCKTEKRTSRACLAPVKMKIGWCNIASSCSRDSFP